MKFVSIFGHVSPRRSYGEWDGWILPKCHIGLEWEFERGGSLKRAVEGQTGLGAYITCKEDGSLRDGGVELVTVGDGLFGRDLIEAIRQLDTLINKTLPAINRPECNYRTAFHVHLDVRDMESEELHNLLLLYCLLEKPLFNFIGNDRWNSNFCIPWARANTQFDVLQNLTVKDAGPILSEKIRRMSRYSALNCASLAKFGTLEWRGMQNDNSELLTRQTTFINIIMMMKRTAGKLYAMGLHGPSLFKFCKELTPKQLIDQVGYPFSTDDWDYGDALILASHMVNFPVPRLEVFADVLYEKFYGTHPNFS